MRTLSFFTVFPSSFFFLFSPNLSDRRVDVYHTSTHGVALVRIFAGNAGRKKSQKIAICTPLHNFVGPYLRNEGTH